MKIFNRMEELLAGGESFVLAVIVSRSGPASRMGNTQSRIVLVYPTFLQLEYKQMLLAQVFEQGDILRLDALAFAERPSLVLTRDDACYVVTQHHADRLFYGHPFHWNS